MFLRIDEVVRRVNDGNDWHLRSDGDLEGTFLERQQLRVIFVSCALRVKPDLCLKCKEKCSIKLILLVLYNI